MNTNIQIPHSLSLNDSEDTRIRNGVDAYKYIKDNLNVFDYAFKSVFIVFYGLYLNDGMRKKLMESMDILQTHVKEKPHISTIDEGIALFKTIRQELKELCRQDEVSFSSKFVHTIWSDFPILDNKIKKYFSIDDAEFYQHSEETIKELYIAYKDYLATKEGKKNVEEFKERYKCDDISDIKIIDFLIWVKQ